jgi:DNA-binding transcriptional MerR regulator
MNKRVLTRDGVLKIGKISDALLKDLEEQKVIEPAGFTEDKTPFYSEDSLEQINHVRRLLDMGYRTEEIQRIAKKIGLPKSSPDEGGGLRQRAQLTIGGLASRVDVSPRTIKHWEDKGIIEPDMRSDGGFRLYPEIYVYLCNLIKDLQLFGYSLDEIKTVSDLFRSFLAIEKNIDAFSSQKTEKKLQEMLQEIERLFKKMNSFKEGISRWEALLTKKKKEIQAFRKKLQKRTPTKKE